MNGDAEPPRAARSPLRRATLTLAAVAAAIAVALLGRRALLRVATLYPDALPAHPLADSAHAVLLYVATPIAVVATLIMLLAPGALLLLATGGESRAGAFIVKSFGAAFALRVLVDSAAKLARLEPLGALAFIRLDLGLDAALAAALVWRAARGREITWPFATPEGRRRLAWCVVIPAVLVVALLPRFFWMDLTDDGLEALAAGRSLVWHVIPRFPNASGYVGLGIGMLAMAFPIHWFVALIGPYEAAARLPMALYLPVLFAVLLELVEWASSRALRVTEEGAIALAVFAFAAAMSFNSSYSPYAADISSPGASFESLTVLCIGATVLFLWRGATAWMLGFVVLGYLARPTELLFLGLVLLASFVVAGEDRRAWMTRAGLGIAACIATNIAYEHVYLPHIAHVARAGFGSNSILARLQYLTLTDIRRVLFAAVPGGLLPFAWLFAWRRQDRHARLLTLATASYFLFFYAQAFAALHHFVPAMVLPVVVFWRSQLKPTSRWTAPTAAALAVVCVWLAVPARRAIDRTPRRIGREMARNAADGLGGPAGASETMLRSGTLTALFPRMSDKPDPARELVLTHLSMLYYAERFGVPADSALFVVRPPRASAPAGMMRVAEDSVSAVFVRDTLRWQWDRTHPPPTDYRSRTFDVPMTALFPFLGVPAGRFDFNLARLPGVWRVFGRR